MTEATEFSTIPPASDPVRRWFRVALRRAHYLPQLKGYETLSAEDELSSILGAAFAIMDSVRDEMLAAGELRRSGERYAPGPNMPAHPTSGALPGIELPHSLVLLLLRHAFVFFPDAAGEAALEAALACVQVKRLEPPALVRRWQLAAARRRALEPRNYPSGPLRDLVHKAMGHLDDGEELEAAQLLDLFDVLTEQLAKRGRDGAGLGPEERTGGHPSTDSPSAKRLKECLKKAQARRQSQTRLMELLQRHRSGDVVDLGDIINAYQDDTQDLRAENLALRRSVQGLWFGLLGHTAVTYFAATPQEAE